MDRKTLKNRPVWIVAASGALLALPAFAQQQQPNDSGRILERDLRVGGGGNSPRADFAKEVARRNALITGNVGGSKSFRGNVGYSAPGDFRGSLGSDALFSFKRDSASGGGVTGRVGSGLRGVEALRGAGGLSEGVVSRSGAGGRAAAAARPGLGELFDPAAVGGLNSGALRTGTLRSTASLAGTSGLGATTVGITRAGEGEDRATPLTASGLLGVRGVRSVALNPGRFDSGRVGGPSKKEDDLRPGMIRPVTQRLAQDLYKGDTTNLNQDMTVRPTRTAYDELRDRMKGAEESASALPKLGAVVITESGVSVGKGEGETPGSDTKDEQENQDRPRESDGMSKLRDRLSKNLYGGAGGSAKGRMTAGMIDPSASTRGDLRSKALEGIDPKTLELIRTQGGTIDRFVDPTTGQLDEYARDMAQGQELLGKRKYFDAEEKFLHALQIKPGDPTATAARTHAQLGAGLYMSASLSLRQLFRDHPDLVGAKYTGQTIPERERLLSIAAEIRGILKDAREAGIAGSSEYGVLLAYLGYQLGDAAVVREGVDSARRSEQAAVEAGQEGDPLIDLVENIWSVPGMNK